MAKFIIINFLILFIFIGNVGMAVFTHSCEEDGTFTSYFIKTDDHCEEEKHPSLPVCCQKEVKKEKDCCNDEVDIFTVKFDYFSSYELSVPPLYFDFKKTTFNFYIEPVISSLNETEHFVHPPPKPSGIELLIHNQVFRI